MEENKQQNTQDNAQQGTQPKNKKKRNVPFIICLIILIAALVILAAYKINLHRQAKTYDDLAEEVTIPVSAPEEVSAPAEVVPEETTPDIPIDFAALQEQNPDIYAWITIPDTEVNLPILHSTEDSAHTDEDYYLDHTVDGTEGLPGAIYTQYSHNKDFGTDPVTVIYGHNMKNGSMFGSLKHYQDEDYRTAHPEVIIYTPEHIYTYRIAFAVTFDDRHILNTYYDCISLLDYEDFLTAIQSERQLPSWIEEPFDIDTLDRTIVLSTCNGVGTQRYLVGAVLTGEQ